MNQHSEAPGSDQSDVSRREVPPQTAIPPAAGSRVFRRGPRVFTGAPPTEITPGAAPAPGENPNLWMPVILAARRHALLELHRRAAAAWTQGLRGRLRRGDALRFNGFSLESSARLAATPAVGGLASLFTIADTRIAGGVIASARLAAYFVGRYPESKPNPQSTDDAAISVDGERLTPLETAVARRALEELVSQLGKLYAAAQIGSLKSVGRGMALAETPLLGQADYLAVFHYSIGAAASGLNLTVIANLELIDAMRAEPAAIPAWSSSARVARLAAAIPVRAAIVLGGWRVSLGELAALRPGDQIVLPDGADAWLEAARIRLRPIRVEVAGQVARAYPNVARNFPQAAGA